MHFTLSLHSFQVVMFFGRAQNICQIWVHCGKFFTCGRIVGCSNTEESCFCILVALKLNTAIQHTRQFIILNKLQVYKKHRKRFFFVLRPFMFQMLVGLWSSSSQASSTTLKLLSCFGYYECNSVFLFLSSLHIVEQRSEIYARIFNFSPSPLVISYAQ